MTDINNSINIPDDIKQQAKCHADANIYLLDNTYLTIEEKVEVETWYQFPGDLMNYVFFCLAVLSVYKTLPWYYIIGIPLFCNVIFGFINWHVYIKPIVYHLGITLFHGWIEPIIGIIIGIFLIVKGSYLWGVVAVFLPFGIFAVFEPSIMLYTLLARKYKMHPKYAFFKKEYAYKFPFEQ